MCMDTAQRTSNEQQRYQALYAKGYPPGNPERLVVWAGAKLEEKVIDFGCGRGTLSRIFARYTGVDFASNAFPKRPGAKQAFIESSLDNLPEAIRSESFDCGVCADVMEHIETDKVDATLDSILSIDCGRILFAICCRESRWRDEQGQLHLTIKPPMWWGAKIAERAKSRWVQYASRWSGGTLYLEMIQVTDFAD